MMAPFIEIRSVYEIRERSSRIYSWSALISSQVLVETPWNLLGSVLFFICWYWTVGFENSRAGYTYLMIAVIFPLYYTTGGQAIAAVAPDATIGSVVYTSLFTFIIAL